MSVFRRLFREAAASSSSSSSSSASSSSSSRKRKRAQIVEVDENNVEVEDDGVPIVDDPPRRVEDDSPLPHGAFDFEREREQDEKAAEGRDQMNHPPDAVDMNNAAAAARPPRVYDVFEVPDNVKWLVTDSSSEKKWCFLCKYDQQAHDLEHFPYYHKLLKFIETNLTVIDPVDMCTAVQQFYNKYLRPVLPADDRKEWEISTIWQHITKHRYSEQSSLFMDYARLDAIMDRIFEHEVFVVRMTEDVNTGVETQQPKLNNAGVNLYLKCLKQKHDIHSSIRRLGNNTSSSDKKGGGLKGKA
ncbi:unnamed protein product [Sphagnum balticum]